jgi:predicted metal-binding membrane protein
MARQVRLRRRGELGQSLTPGPVDASGPLERLLRRDRALMLCALALLVALSVLYLLRGAHDMQAMDAAMRRQAAAGVIMDMRWGFAEWAGLLLMWTIMMVAMMLPSAAPVILLVLGVYRRRGGDDARLAAGLFVAGYLLAWTGFSVLAATIQIGLHRTALMTMDMRLGPATLAGTVLVAAGLYQWLPVKTLCLSHCQSPLGFISSHWREGPLGALLTGAHHGLFCVGCCGFLMGVLLVVGVMQLSWVAAIAAVALMEKVLPQGLWLGRLAGSALVVAGLYLWLKPLSG